ncbi:hypothetical protein Tco_0704533 [Tanacetum coccineum]|uniref:Uncharacterized protein n=1 Tax=Tanacetum coccineum TaxID=301880 RepID=A0ABQ4Y3F2_9ASTR
MLVLPADPGLWSEVISRWESIIINRLNNQTWSDNKAKLAFVENLLGESEKLMWQQWQTVFPKAYSALEAIADEPQNITSQELVRLLSLLAGLAALLVMLYFVVHLKLVQEQNMRIHTWCAIVATLTSHFLQEDSHLDIISDHKPGSAGKTSITPDFVHVGGRVYWTGGGKEVKKGRKKEKRGEGRKGRGEEGGERGEKVREKGEKERGVREEEKGKKESRGDEESTQGRSCERRAPLGPLSSLCSRRFSPPAAGSLCLLSVLHPFTPGFRISFVFTLRVPHSPCPSLSPFFFRMDLCGPPPLSFSPTHLPPSAPFPPPCCSFLFEKTSISSIYTTMNDYVPLKHLSIFLWNTAGAFFRPNGITSHS